MSETTTRFSRGMSTPAMRATCAALPLPLLVLGDDADDHDHAGALDDLATLAAWLHGGRNLHLINGESIPTRGIPEVYSRETSVFNFGSPPANVEAIGREVSVFNGESVPSSGIPEVYSREVTTFNFGEPTAGTEAISRELSILNTAP